MTGPPFYFCRTAPTPWPHGVEVADPHRSPWAPAPPLCYHEAKTVVVYAPAILRAADPPPRR